MSTCRSPRIWRWSLPFVLTQALWINLPGPAQAQAQEAKPVQKDEGRKGDERAEPVPPKREPRAILADPNLVKEPNRWRVYQRDRSNRAEIPIVLDSMAEGASIVNVAFQRMADGFGGAGLGAGPAFHDGKLVGVPVGGPYFLLCTVRLGDAQQQVRVGPLFVGDLWVLAGQSNMEGYGNLEDVSPPAERVAVLGMDGRWAQAEEPLHWLVDSPDPVHSEDPATREQRSTQQHQDRKKGAGLGLAFATIMVASTGVPVGLVACAHGGTSMAQWDPAKKDEGGKSLYGSMLRQVNLAGGRVRGVLWYQGESDAQPGVSETYPKAMVHFIASVRDDFHDPDLPFYLVQIGRFVMAAPPKGWNVVQDAQRQLPDRVPNTAVVASVDLALDDLIHVSTPDLKRLGARLARIAQRELFGQLGATTPTFDRVNRRDDTTLVVKFKGVNRVSNATGPMASALGQNASPMLLVGGVPNAQPGSPGQPLAGFQPARHIAGFSIRQADGTDLPLIYDASVGPTKDTVILRLTGKVPDGASLWYGYGLDPYCNLTDVLDMAVPAFGPIALDEAE